MATSRKFASTHADVLKKMILLQERATTLIHDSPKKAAADSLEYLSSGLLSLDLVERAMNKVNHNFYTNPHVIIEDTKMYYNFMKQQGLLTGEFDAHKIFDTSFYDQVTAKK